ncbi:enoyl-CoA hydratase-related protein [Paraburkholderia sp. MPAMCS5]|uniref:enoyl-CoA hydratase-related protein n=1 Tax=Paraburkholderia sp. MPAMCS5 TaxID=3112563 RepID=UPI002E178BC5|nr:enoyl-CoA hydratase-related protein [Paraburkholderia sp. MPAMCS5]
MNIHTSQGPHGVLICTIDAQESRVNVINDALLEDIEQLIGRLETDADVTGAVLTSGKRDFVVGADLQQVYGIETPQAAMQIAERYKALLRRLEKCQKPVVAAMNGTALGGGYELALACHHRVALHRKEVMVGLPEVKFGLLPGGGGTQRLTRMLGVVRALPLLLEGTTMSAEDGYRHGLIDTLASDEAALMDKSIAWVRACKEPTQPWDRSHWRIPGGDPRDPAVAQQLAALLAGVEANTYGVYPVIVDIFSCVYEGSLLDIDNALKVESRYFAHAVTSRVSKNMLHTLWFQHNSLKKQAASADAAPVPVHKLAVIGAGEAGTGIASIAADAGIEVVFVDTAARTASGDMSQAGVVDIQGCQLVIDAISECVTSQQTASDNAWFGDVPNLIRLSWPAQKCSILEIVRTAHTSQQALARALGFARQIGRTPIVVDGRSYAKELAMHYVSEALRLFSEGEQWSRIEMSALKAGMKMGPLALLDEMGIDTFISTIAASQADPNGIIAGGFEEVLRTLSAQGGCEARGSANTHGDVDFRAAAGSSEGQLEETEIAERLLFVQVMAAADALKEGHVRTVADANVASVLAVGFCPQHGGALQFANTYGIDAFVARAEALAHKHGERFMPAPLLRDMAARGSRFADQSAGKAVN